MPFNSRRKQRHVITADIRVIDAHGVRTDLVAVDLSVTGIGTDGLTQLAEGQAVRIEWPDGTVQGGTTVWRDDFSGGLLFDRQLTEEEFERVMYSLAARPRFARQTDE